MLINTAIRENIEIMKQSVTRSTSLYSQKLKLKAVNHHRFYKTNQINVLTGCVYD